MQIQGSSNNGFVKLIKDAKVLSDLTNSLKLLIAKLLTLPMKKRNSQIFILYLMLTFKTSIVTRLSLYVNSNKSDTTLKPILGFVKINQLKSN